MKISRLEMGIIGSCIGIYLYAWLFGLIEVQKGTLAVSLIIAIRYAFMYATLFLMKQKIEGEYFIKKQLKR